MAGCWPGLLLEPRLKPGHTLSYDLVYLSFYEVDDHWLMTSGGDAARYTLILRGILPDFNAD